MIVGVTSTGSYAQTELLDSAEQGMYSAEGLYEPEIVRYKNGLTLAMKQRTGGRSVSLRVSVGVGMAHYECGQRHVPHFLEHMLYGGIPEISAEEVQRRLFELGATSNAHTYPTQTVYEIDVFSGTAMQALDLTADMLTKSELRQGSFEQTKRVIFHEKGGEPGPVEREALVGGRLASGEEIALSRVSPRLFGACGVWDTGQDVKFASVTKAYEDYYVPSNMVWVVVGNFERDVLLNWAEDRLASLASRTTQRPEEPNIRGFGARHYSGYSDEPAVAIMAITKGLLSEDYYAHVFIEHLLNARLFEKLRVTTALTYTPFATLYSAENVGVFKIKAEVRYEDRIETLKIIDQLVAEVTNSTLDEMEFRTIQLSLLRTWARNIDDNTEYAEHYINSLSTFRRDGYFVNEEARIAALTPQTVQRAARKLFAEDNVVYVLDDDRQSIINADP